MNASEDVKVLFRRFGGEANSYQEVVRERAAGVALGKWTMLGQVDILQPQTVESVRRVVKMPAVRQTSSDYRHEPRIHQPIAVSAPQMPEPLPRRIHAVTVPVPAPIPDLVPIPLRNPMAMRGLGQASMPSQAHVKANLRGNALSDFLGKKPSQPDPVVTSLGLRLNKQLLVKPQPDSNERFDNQSLTRLFARLTQSALSGSASMALQRKFHK